MLSKTILFSYAILTLFWYATGCFINPVPKLRRILSIKGWTIQLEFSFYVHTIIETVYKIYVKNNLIPSLKNTLLVNRFYFSWSTCDVINMCNTVLLSLNRALSWARKCKAREVWLLILSFQEIVLVNLNVWFVFQMCCKITKSLQTK